MSGLDRDKARDVLGTWMRSSPDSMSNEEFLDRLEECVQPDPGVGTAVALHHAKDFARPSGRIVQLCKVCNVTYPCATRRALESATA